MSVRLFDWHGDPMGSLLLVVCVGLGLTVALAGGC